MKPISYAPFATLNPKPMITKFPFLRGGKKTKTKNLVLMPKPQTTFDVISELLQLLGFVKIR